MTAATATPPTPDALLTASSQPELRRLRVTESDAEVVITGRVSSYYLKQLAQEALRPAVFGRKLLNRVEVVCRT